MDRPLLALDRPFTYRLPEGMEAGVGSLVRVPFHGRATRGWLLGPTDDVPPRVLAIRQVVSTVRFFDDGMLELFRWVAERYVAPLATAIARGHPPRVVSEEGTDPAAPPASPAGRRPGVGGHLATHRGGGAMLEALAGARDGAYLLRPAPEARLAAAVEAVEAVLAAGRRAVVLVPEADPLPATARALVDAFGDAVGLYLGGDRRRRYRTWLDILAGRHRVVVGTRPAVFAPVEELGLVWVSREHHPAHREERAPYYHVRDVALARARLQGAVCVLESLCPSAEAVASGAAEVIPARRAWPPVEVVRPGPEGRAPRLVSVLREARRGFLYAPLPGSGVAQVCRSCGAPAACAACGGLLRAAEGRVACVVCERSGACAACGGADFGIRRGGAERVERWARGVARGPVRRARTPQAPGAEEILVGGAEAVGDVDVSGLDVVGVLDVDVAARRPGLAATERSLATWIEVAAWAQPRGRVVVQSRTPNDPAVQALVAGSPARFHRAELPRRERAGFPVGAPVFRVAGTGALPRHLEELGPVGLLVSAAEGGTVCLITLAPGGVGRFGRLMRELSASGVAVRVEAEPHL